MEMTPPISPTTNANDFPDSSLLQDRGKYGFHCVGEASKRIPFDSGGFVSSGEGNLAESVSDLSLKQTFLTIFDQLFDIDSVGQDVLERLFRVSRNRFCQLDSAQRATVGTFGILTGYNNSSTSTDCGEVRQELREFFIALRIFIMLESKEEQSSWVLEEMLPVILKGLSLTRTQLGWLTDLPSYVLSHSHHKSGSKSAAHHLFHCHLELRWLHISVLWTLSSCLSAAPRFQATQVTDMVQSYSSDSSIQNLLQSAIFLCVVDLLEMAVLKFNDLVKLNKLNQEQIVHTSPFNCMCVKELWLLMRLVTEKLHCNDPKSFWKLLDGFIELLKDDSQSISKKGWRTLQQPSKITCLEPGLFAVWFLRHIGELFIYSSNGAPLTVIGPGVESGYVILKRVLGHLTSNANEIEESQRRALIGLMRPLLAEPWKPKPEPIMMLWEGFCRKLDSAFQLPGAPTSSYTITSDTIQDILASVNIGTNGKPQKSNSSFEMFLSLLGNYLKNDPSQWKLKMCGRFYSKLSEKKVDGLTERGLYHLTQLFLLIAAHTDVEELGLRFNKLVQFSETDESRNLIVMKARLCFVFLCAQEGKQLSALAYPLTKLVNSLIGKRQTSVVQVFIDNLKYIVQSSGSLPLDLHILFGEWVKNFLQQHHRQESVQNFLDVMVNVMEQVLINMDSNNTVGGGVEKLVSTLRENLLPYVKEQKKFNLDQIADLAVYFTLISTEFNSFVSSKDSFQNLLHQFLMGDVCNVALTRKYLYRILSHSKIENIVQGSETQQLIFIQAWVRCCTLNTNLDQDRVIAQKILAMPVLTNAFNLPAEGIISTPDPLIHLIELLGSTPNSNKKTFLMLIEPLKQLVPLLKLSLFGTKLKDTSWKSENNISLEKEVIVRAFLVFGKLICDCALFIYEKNTSSNFLITLINMLILHPNVYDMDVRLPLAMDDGLRRSLFLYLRGLYSLDPNKDKCVQRFVCDIVQLYVPRFGVIPQNDPFIKIWDEPEHMSPAMHILQVVCETLLQVDKRTNLPHKYYVQGLHLINELVVRNERDEILLGVLIGQVFPSCLYVVAKVTDSSANNRRQETEKTLKLMFDSEAYLTNTHFWEQTSNVLNRLSHKFLGFHSTLVMRMLVFLVKEFKPIVKRFIPTLEANIEEVNAKRGCGKDKNLESQLATLKAEMKK